MHLPSLVADPNEIAQTCIMQALRSTARLITQRNDDALRSEDLTASQFTILAAISVQSGIKVTTLAERVGMDRTTLNRVLAPLQRRGLVRHRSEPRRRACQSGSLGCKRESHIRKGRPALGTGAGPNAPTHRRRGPRRPAGQPEGASRMIPFGQKRAFALKSSRNQMTAATHHGPSGHADGIGNLLLGFGT